MPPSFIDTLFGGGAGAVAGLADVIAPRRTFRDVVLPEATRRALNRALTQIEKHDVLYRDWGLAERHSTGLSLAFNFAGPPGTGKTICAEAVAHRLGRRLMIVRQADLQSMWVGKTGKNVAALFEAAEKSGAVLFFDEADAIASRRFSTTTQGYEREANAVVSVLLRELESFGGVVIFATNLATSFDPAFERRIRTHVLFERPGAALRERIWRVQLHPQKTPLAEDVDFRALAERYEATGGDIKNAVLKAAQAAIAEAGPDAAKKIHQRHFVEGMDDVLAAKEVMQQSLFDAGDGTALPWPLPHVGGQETDAMTERQDALEDEQHVLRSALELHEEQLHAARAQLNAARAAAQEGANRLGALAERLDERLDTQHVRLHVALWTAAAALLLALLACTWLLF